MSEVRKNLSRSDTLDILRGILAIWVMLAHAIPWASYYQGDGAVSASIATFAHAMEVFFQGAGETHPAVLLFIVLSGYCIHRNGLRRGAPVAPYAIRRAFRIYPIYLIAIAVGVAAWLISSEIIHQPLEIAGTAIITPGCVVAKATGVVSIWPELHRCAFAGNAPLNTVMTEIWLYIAYPLLLIGIGYRFGMRALAGVVVAIFAVGLVGLAVWPELHHWWRSASLPGFLLFWWIGALATDPRAAAALRKWSPLFAIAFAALSIVVLSGPYAQPLIAEARKLCLALIAAGVIARLDRPWRIWPPLALVGRAGYSIYAFHAPLLYTLLIAGAPWWVACLAAILVGVIMYAMIEKPLMNLGARLARQQSGPLVTGLGFSKEYSDPGPGARNRFGAP